MADEVYYWPHEKYESPDRSPPNEETLKKFNLIYSNGQVMKPAYCDLSEVWATAIHKNSPVYAIFNRGTNWIFILERIGDGEWKEVRLDKVKNLHGFIWRIVALLSMVNK